MTTTDTKTDVMTYPMRCTSQFCGKSGDDCGPTCGAWKQLQAFKSWRHDRAAVQVDPIWDRLTYKATR